MVKIVDATQVQRTTRKSPATRMIESLPDGYLTSRDMAEKFGCSIETIRRYARMKNPDGTDRFKAPSKAAKSGDLVIWVYTPEDVEEMADHFGQRLPRKRGRAR